MATKRRPLHTGSKLNFRPGTSSESSTCDPKGKKPLPEPTTVRKVLLMMILHVCRKTLFFDTNLKVGIYGASLFLISLVTDVLPVPKTYFARSDNIFNQYFVKMGWGWTLLMTFPFVVLTSYTYCCGKKDKVVMHVSRLGIATFMWFFWTKLFQYIESNYGRCVAKAHLSTKAACIGKGHMWNGFDLSGHAFILIYSSLVLIEEARAINGWERMSDLIRNEGYTRDTADGSLNVNPLRSLTEREFSNLKAFYEQFTPYIHSLFIGMTCLCILWDVMLVSTMLYYHIMIEKFVSGAIAILMWFVTYRYWYALPKVFPNLPGDGLFKYTNRQQSREIPTKKKTSTPNVAKGQLPKFMGMPLYGLRNQETKMKDGMKDEKEEQYMDEMSPASSSKVSMT